MNNPMTYIQNGDYLIPDLKLSQQPEKPLGKYGRMRKTYLKEHRPRIYTKLLLGGDLHKHLADLDEQARERHELIVKQMAQAEGVTEHLKMRDQMAWIGRMDNIAARADEIICTELIFN